MESATEARGSFEGQGDPVGRGMFDLEARREIDHVDGDCQGKIFPPRPADMKPQHQGQYKRQDLEWKILSEGTLEEIGAGHGRFLGVVPERPIDLIKEESPGMDDIAV